MAEISEVEVVIKLPMDKYEHILECYDKKSLVQLPTEIALIIAVHDGTRLPNSHERLISVDKLDVSKLVDSDTEWISGRCGISRVQDMIDSAPTVVRAFKPKLSEDWD